MMTSLRLGPGEVIELNTQRNQKKKKDKYIYNNLHVHISLRISKTKCVNFYIKDDRDNISS